MRRLGVSILLSLALAGSSLAQEPAEIVQTLEETLTMGGVAAPTAEDQPVDANAVSAEIFGPRAPVDEAFGAFQRGYFLTALALALPRAEQGDAAAQTLIAEIYAKGLGVAENIGRAAGWYALASQSGSAVATFELAMLYQSGQGVPKDRKKAAELFAKAAEGGSVPAKYNLALLHIEGLYADPSLTQAAELMKQAAEADLPEARYDYGTMLLEGAGIAPDPAEAARQIGLAAEAGLPVAQVDYATMLYLGQGVMRDLGGAVRWYKRAADAGSAVAQNRYAKLLAVGEGVPLDLVEAAMWRALARRQGLNDATLDKLLVSISKDDLALAEERARFWPSVPQAANAETTEVAAPKPLPATLPGSSAQPSASTTAVDAGSMPEAPAGDAGLDPNAPLPATRGATDDQKP